MDPDRSRQSPQQRTPRRALGVSLICLLVAAVAAVSPPAVIRDQAGFIWLLALVPVFLLAYHRGWKGAAIAAAAGMVALTIVQLVLIRLLGQAIDWWLLGAAIAILAPITLGAGLLAELLRRQRSMALELAYHDPLTNVANRRLLRERVHQAIAATRGGQTRVGLVFVDLVHFKGINDTLGHAAGDHVLGRLAARLDKNCRAGDFVARAGGDEFVVCLTGIRSLEEALTAAGRIRDLLEQPFDVAGESITVDGRLGVALYPDHASSFDELLSIADPVTLSSVKRPHGGILIPDPASTTPAREQLLFEGELRQMLDRGEGLAIVYQPIAETAGGRAVGAEALARLDHPKRGLIKAADFIPLAQDSGLMRRLEQSVLKGAIAQAREWQGADSPDWVAVNLSPATFEGADFVSDLETILSDAGLPPQRLVLEITERIAMRRPKVVASSLHELRELGVRVAIDDFGTGHSSLAYLAHFWADFLKLDMLFTREIGKDSKQERLIEGIVGLASGLGMQVIAEGVEKAEQLEWLRDAGCTLVQGYYVGRPGFASQLTRALGAA